MFPQQFLKHRADDQMMANVVFERLERARADDACAVLVLLGQESWLKLWGKKVSRKCKCKIYVYKRLWIFLNKNLCDY